MDKLKKELPFDVESPGAETKSAEIPGYVEPFERCANCKHFKAEGDEQMCGKYNLPADLDGHCPSFTEAEAEPPSPDEVEEPEDAE
jgi:hypothetical protein